MLRWEQIPAIFLNAQNVSARSLLFSRDSKFTDRSTSNAKQILRKNNEFSNLPCHKVGARSHNFLLLTGRDMIVFLNDR